MTLPPPIEKRPDNYGLDKVLYLTPNICEIVGHLDEGLLRVTVFGGLFGLPTGSCLFGSFVWVPNWRLPVWAACLVITKIKSIHQLRIMETQILSYINLNFVLIMISVALNLCMTLIRKS